MRKIQLSVQPPVERKKKILDYLFRENPAIPKYPQCGFEVEYLDNDPPR